MVLVNATDIKNWASLTDAHNQMPRLVRRLIYATGIQIERMEFPSDESVQSGGWDGIAVVEKGNAFLPDGCSVWEMGANVDVKGKADGDYEKRCKEPLRNVSRVLRQKSDSVFV